MAEGHVSRNSKEGWKVCNQGRESRHSSDGKCDQWLRVGNNTFMKSEK